MTAPRGLAGRVASAWLDPRGAATRELATSPGEARLLAYALGGCIALWIARLPSDLLEAQRLAATGAEAPTPAMVVTANLVSMLFFTPLMLYGVAALARLALRAAGGSGGWVATRHAVFWSLLVASPAILIGGALGFALDLSGRPGLAEIPPVAASLAWLWFWCSALAEAHGFRRAWPVFAALVGLAAVLSFLATAGSP